jgi:hypothetical protein
MPPLSTLLPFFGISLVLGLTPGPDNLFVLLQSAMRGSRSGMVIFQSRLHAAQKRRCRVSCLSGVAGVACAGRHKSRQGRRC